MSALRLDDVRKRSHFRAVAVEVAGQEFKTLYVQRSLCSTEEGRKLSLQTSTLSKPILAPRWRTLQVREESASHKRAVKKLGRSDGPLDKFSVQVAPSAGEHAPIQGPLADEAQVRLAVF